MKFRTYGMILSVLFALGLVFSFGVEASASHDGTDITAADVTLTSEDDVKAFLDHIIDYYNQSYRPDMDDLETQNTKLVKYGRAIREDSGVYFASSNNMYSMGINENGIVTNHPRYPEKYGYEFVPDASGSAVASTIQTLIDGSDVVSTECEMYGDQGRVACATKVESPSGRVTVIAGLHHAENDSAFEFPDCTDLPASNYISAMDVNDKESLKNYVEGSISIAQELLTNIGGQLFREHGRLFTAVIGGTATDEQVAEAGKLTSQKLFEKVACFSNEESDNGPVLKHGAIYGFIMNTDTNATVLFNGNNPALNGLDLQVNDPNPIDEENIAKLIRDAVTDDQGELKLGPEDGAFVEYHWDDPTTDADNNEGWFERQEVPGTSRKISYVKAANLNTSGIGPPAIYIFGSGIYPGMDDDPMDDDTPTSGSDDDGCSIAGVGNTSQATLLNLLLTVSILFSVVFLRRRI